MSDIPWPPFIPTPLSVDKAHETYEKFRAENMRQQQHQERRDRFAAAAMQSLITVPCYRRENFETAAKYAVIAADALIAELDKPQEKK